MAKTYNTGFTDAESVNESSRTTFLYKDFSLFFTLNPVTSDITTITDVQDIKRAVRNLVMTNEWDRPFHPEIASGLRESLLQRPVASEVASSIIVHPAEQGSKRTLCYFKPFLVVILRNGNIIKFVRPMSVTIEKASFTEAF